MKPDVLLAIDIVPSNRSQLEAVYNVHQATTPEARAEAARQHGASIRAIMTNGTTIIPAALIEELPQLGIICAQGVGYEGIDLPAARARGIVVTHGPGTNADCVADHTMALLLAALRDLPGNDARVRAGQWREGSTMRPAATGKKLGLLGMGQIAARIARRAAGFDMPVGYHSRRARPESELPFFPNVLALAEWADILVIAVPGGAGTRHMVDAAVLAALGPESFLVNIGRGSVVDTAALIAALQTGGLAGAALDVIEGEPAVPEALRALGNVVLSPHMGGRSPESVQATITLVLQNLEAFFAGRPVLTPVPD
jgi:lactate dehydrogenase-like 2-hydroxyacid dehydrogenase